MPAIYSGNKILDKIHEIGHTILQTTGRGADRVIEASQPAAKAVNKLSGLGPLAQGLGDVMAGQASSITPEQTLTSGLQGILSVASLGGAGMAANRAGQAAIQARAPIQQAAQTINSFPSSVQPTNPLVQQALQQPLEKNIVPNLVRSFKDQLLLKELLANNHTLGNVGIDNLMAAIQRSPQLLQYLLGPK